MAVFKRDDLGFPTFWTVQIAAWVCFYLWGTITLFPFLRQPGALLGNTVFFVSLFVVSSLLRPVCRSLIGRLLIGRSLMGPAAIGHAASWIALELRAFLWSLLGGIVAGLVIERATSFHRPLGWVDWLGNSVRSTFILFVWCSLYFSIKLWLQAIREQERLRRAEAEARDARLSALRYQLNPHFLFNSLNAVSTLVLEGNPPAATRMLSQIGDFLRTILDTEAAPETSLSEEIAFAEQYLAIEQTRLGARLRVNMAISPETLDALVPTMLLQPLIENAVRHGIAPVVEGGTLDVESKLYGGQLQIKINNSGPANNLTKQTESSAGVGIGNTIERLKALYAADHQFRLRWLENGGCEVTIELPFSKSAPLKEASSCAH